LLRHCASAISLAPAPTCLRRPLPPRSAHRITSLPFQFWRARCGFAVGAAYTPTTPPPSFSLQSWDAHFCFPCCFPPVSAPPTLYLPSVLPGSLTRGFVCVHGAVPSGALCLSHRAIRTSSAQDAVLLPCYPPAVRWLRYLRLYRVAALPGAFIQRLPRSSAAWRCAQRCLPCRGAGVYLRTLVPDAFAVLYNSATVYIGSACRVY